MLKSVGKRKYQKGVPFGIVEIFRGKGRMVCSTACGAFHAYADGISDMQAGKIDRNEKSCVYKR